MSIGLVSDYRSILFDDQYFRSEGGHLHSLLSNFNSFEDSDPESTPDFTFELIDRPSAEDFRLDCSGSVYSLTGPIEKAEAAVTDKRSSVFGNMGLFSKIVVRELEKRGVFSFHSTSFCRRGENRIYLVLGGSGAGKSSVLLKAQTEELDVFGTELTHFRITDGKTEMLMGSLWQNCRMGNLVVDFPELLDKYGIKWSGEGDPWHQYKSVDMGRWQAEESLLSDPEIIILFPRIESERENNVINRSGTGGIDYKLYSNLADKVSPPSMLYGKHFIPSVDDGTAQKRRMTAATEFKTVANITSCWEILANPDSCLNGII